MATVAVIGLGAFGLVTLKNLLEEGYDAIGFEKSPYVGGLWHYTAARSVSALPSTIVNVSRQRCCYTDFPFRDGTSSYPTAAEVDEYLNEYAEAFNLRGRCKLSTEVMSVRNLEKRWEIKTKSNSDELTQHVFDKVVCANGNDTIPKMPTLENSTVFKGSILHVIDYKNSEDFKGQSVMVVGLGNSAADTATSLVGIAKTVYLSHRGGRLFLPRFMPDGSCFDHSASYRTFVIRDLLESVAPQLATKFVDYFVQSTQNKIYRFRPEWNLLPTPSLLHRLPLVSDTLVADLEAGRIHSVPAPSKAIGGDEIELTDGNVLKVDTIIFCTGYRRDYSFLGPHDPTLVNSDSGGEDQKHNFDTPKLYQNVLSIEYPDSLAFVGTAITYFAAFLGADLSSMAIAQLWKIPSHLPSQIEMQKWYDGHLQWAADIRKTGEFIPNMTQFGSWMQWIEAAADTQVDDHVRYSSLEAWKLWWRDPKLSKLLMEGIYVPQFFRLFPGKKRKAWPGARAAIEKVNIEAAEQKRERAEKMKG